MAEYQCANCPLICEKAFPLAETESNPSLAKLKLITDRLNQPRRSDRLKLTWPLSATYNIFRGLAGELGLSPALMRSAFKATARMGIVRIEAGQHTFLANQPEFVATLALIQRHQEKPTDHLNREYPTHEDLIEAAKKNQRILVPSCLASCYQID